MKKTLLLIITLFLTAQITKAQTVVLDANGVTVKWTGTTVPSPYFVQASPRGTLEWFAIVDDGATGIINGYAQNFQSAITYFTPPSTSTPIPFNNIVTTLVNDMSGVFTSCPTFNQPVRSWDVSNVFDMNFMFGNATAFNQSINSWNVSNVLNMSNMFQNAYAFNQSINSWNVSNVSNMIQMFHYATSFNKPIGSWNVSNVENMSEMLAGAASFNQSIGSWNVSNVTNMIGLFAGTSVFNQPIGSWNVSNVTAMDVMFSGVQLSTANYDDLLLGWSTISPNETPLKPNVIFSGGNSNYCNGEAARNTLISTYGWTITDAGLNCNLSTETFDAISLKLYPNPVTSVLNVKVDYNLINQPYSIVDGLGRVVLNGNLIEVDTAINVEQLSKGIYYLKLSDSNASKFVKE